LRQSDQNIFLDNLFVFLDIIVRQFRLIISFSNPDHEEAKNEDA